MKNIGFTVPPSMVEELEQLAKEERRTKSELSVSFDQVIPPVKP